MITVSSPLEAMLEKENAKTWKPTFKQEKFLQVPFDVDEAGYGGALMAGKDLALDTLIFTPEGFKYLQDIHAGDIVFNHFGAQVKVLAESEVFTDHKCYEVSFDCGEKIIAGEDHLWWLFNQSDKQKLYKRTDEYREKRRLNRAKKSKGSRPDLALNNSKRVQVYKEAPVGRLSTTKELNVNESIKVAESVSLGYRELPIPPYVLGCWLGDGSSNDSRFTSADEEILHRINWLGYSISSYDIQYSYRILGLTAQLRQYSLLNNKHIPKDYFLSHEFQREELLQGIMDTDGHIDRRGRCELTLTDKKLSEDCLQLIRSLGIRASMSFGRATLYGKDCGEKYIIHFTTAREVFKLERKIARLRDKVDESTKWHYIKEVKEILTVNTKCIQVEGSIYVVGKSFIPTHNSDVLMLMPLIYGFHNNPKFKGLFLRRTFPELEQEIIPRSQEFFPSSGGIYNIAKHRWEWPNGAMDIFGHLKDEKDVKKYDTGQFPLIRWDESTSFTGFQYEYITLRRNRAPVGYGLPAFTRWGSNPGNIGHGYFRKRFIDPCKQGGKIIRDAKTGAKRIFIPATAQDNPHGLLENPKYFQKLQGISSEAERRAMILGDWYCFEGQVFEEFRLEPLPDEPDFAQHVIPPFDIPHWWPKLISIDWGFSAWCFAIWWAVSPEGRVFIYRCYAVKKTKIKQWTRDIALLSGNEIPEVRDVRICWSAIQDQGHDQTIFEQVSEALGEAGFTCGLTKGEKNRVAGKQLIHEYLRWKPLPSVKSIIGDYNVELARKIERIKGPDALKEYVKYFEPEKQEFNLPKMQIFSHVPNGDENVNAALNMLIEAIPSCVYDETKKEDVKEWDGDDPYDCARIGLYAIRDYFDSAGDEAAKQERLGMAAKHLAKTNDQTSYYRKCEHIEASQKKVFSVRRQSSRFGRMSGMRSTSRGVRH